MSPCALGGALGEWWGGVAWGTQPGGLFEGEQQQARAQTERRGWGHSQVGLHGQLDPTARDAQEEVLPRASR